MVCSSGVGFDPRVDGKRLHFGMEGSWRGTATMHDRETKSVWLQLTGTCISGRHEGTELKPLRHVRHTTWHAWRSLHPETQVMARRQANLRPGDKYFDAKGTRSGSPVVPSELRAIVRTDDRRLDPHALLYGVYEGGAARAYPLQRLRGTPVVEERLGGVDVSVWFDKASRSVAGFKRAVGERTLSFRAAPEGAFEDAETHSRWTLDGLCVKGPLEGTALEPVRGFLAEWYGWLALNPETTIWGQ